MNTDLFQILAVSVAATFRRSVLFRLGNSASPRSAAADGGKRRPRISVSHVRLALGTHLLWGPLFPARIRPAGTAQLILHAAGEPRAGGVATATTSSVMPKHEFSVDMTCEGCSNAVTRVLNKLGGVQFDIDLPNKKVCIDSEHSVDTLLETLGKTGKAVSYLGPK